MGLCALCERPAPSRASSGEPFLESGCGSAARACGSRLWLQSSAAGWASDAVVLEVDAALWGTRQVLEVWHDVPMLHPDRDCDLVNNRLALHVDPCEP